MDSRYQTRSLPFKIGEIPPVFLSEVVEECWIEVHQFGSLNLDPEVPYELALLEKKCKNHVVLRFSFKGATQGTISGGLRIRNIKGVKINMKASYDYGVGHPGLGSNLVVKFLDYSGADWNSVKCIDVPIIGHNTTLGQMIKPAIEARLEEFTFVHDGQEYTGCRDWISQFIRLLEIKGLIHANLTGESVYKSLNYRYIEDDRRFFKAVGMGRFRVHTRVDINDIVYAS